MTRSNGDHRTSWPWWKRKKRDEEDKERRRLPPRWKTTAGTAASAAFPSFRLCLRAMLGVTVALYVLNQKHLLPKPLSAVVSQTLFWPTLPITVGRRLGRWSTVVDDTVVMGGAPFGFAKLPEKLRDEYNVHGVINLCREYKGPLRQYSSLGMTELYLPTTDHFEPSLETYESAVEFIQKYRKQGERVYVHCRAGHGRSAAVVFAWLLSRDPKADRKQLNEEFCRLRDVRKTLWKQTNIREFHEKLLGRTGGTAVDESEEGPVGDDPL